jgi:ATP-binding cassette subfamily B protein
VQENLAGQMVVRAFSREAGEEKSFAIASDHLYRSAMRLAHVRLVMFPLMGLVGSTSIAIALLLGGRAVVEGRMSTGDVWEMLMRLGQLAWPTLAMGFIMSVYQRGKASLVRIDAVLAAQPDIVDGTHTAPLRGDVAAKNLTVELPTVERPLLKDVSFSTHRGSVLGVVGRNGSGKTTLVRALARMQVVPQGQLFFDGVDANDWHLVALHSGVAVVPDDGFLFSATLRENLSFGVPDATAAEVDAAVALCDLVRDVGAMPEGLGTMVGERGITLSGGQRQRTALARAILTRPAVLILDDSLSAVDAETEAKIVSSLRGGFRGLPTRADHDGTPPTLVVVSHRLSAVREADEILVLDQGAVAERGTHDALLAAGGIYADLWGQEQLRKALDKGSA